MLRLCKVADDSTEKKYIFHFPIENSKKKPQNWLGALFLVATLLVRYQVQVPDLNLEPQHWV